MIKIALVDDHKILRDGIKLSLLGSEKISLVLECGTAEELLEKFDNYNPDIFVIDMSLPDMNGDELILKLINLNPETKAIVLSSLTDENSVISAVKSGAKAYISKDAGTDELLEAIETVFNGEEYFGGKISKIIFKSFSKINSDNTQSKLDLSERETEVLKLFADGMSYKEIAEKLFISHRTVETHKKSIMRKLELNNLADLIKYSIRNGIISI